ncbi:MAG: hypothetical protein ACSHXF_05630 [Aquaticitalea sp.]
MKNHENQIDERLTINESNIPLESSLGLLAYGDIAFTAWRKIKRETSKEN